VTKGGVIKEKIKFPVTITPNLIVTSRLDTIPSEINFYKNNEHTFAITFTTVTNLPDNSALKLKFYDLTT
jgi:hypothetical protein